MKRLLLAGLLWLIPVSGWAVVVWDAATVNDNSDSDTSSSFSHTIGGSVTNGYTGACIATRGGGATIAVSSVDIGGSAATLLRAADTAASEFGTTRIEIWGRATGSTTGAITINPTVASADRFRTTAFSLSGVDQTTPVGTVPAAVTATATSITQNVSSAVNQLVVSCTAINTSGVSGVTAGAGQTSRQLNNTDLNNTYEDLTTEPGAGTVTMSESWTGISIAAHVAAPFNEAAAATAQSRLLMGVGN
jgi:hypothetical protein